MEAPRYRSDDDIELEEEVEDAELDEPGDDNIEGGGTQPVAGAHIDNGAEDNEDEDESSENDDEDQDGNQQGRARRRNDDGEKPKRNRPNTDQLPGYVKAIWPRIVATYIEWIGGQQNPFYITDQSALSAIQSIYDLVLGDNHPEILTTQSLIWQLVSERSAMNRSQN